MLNVLIICNSGAGSSAMLKNRLEKMIPEHSYHASSVAKVGELFGKYDLVLTFDELKPFVVKEIGDPTYTVKTIEEFNSFAKSLFNEFLQG